MPGTRRTLLTCPKCRDPMNHHAEKLVVSADPELEVDSELGGYIEELHNCPGCGHLESRR
jgi:hypothetical protein